MNSGSAPSLVLVGDWAGDWSLLQACAAHGYVTTVAPNPGLLPPSMLRDAALVVAVVTTGLTPTDLAAQLSTTRWLAWNRGDDQDLALAAYRAGALVVLPGASDTALLLRTIEQLLDRSHELPSRQLSPPPPLSGVYRRGEIIVLSPDALLEVQHGVVAQHMIHADGAPVLLGLYGPGQLLVGHPTDSCYLELRAHTAVSVNTQSWQEAQADPALAERLRATLRSLEAWAAIQARPYLDQRILGLLSLLSEQFGSQVEGGMVVDVRLTHGQLATAVNATRSTVTKVLGELRARGVLSWSGAGDEMRFCLHRWEFHQHGRERHA